MNLKYRGAFALWLMLSLLVLGQSGCGFTLRGSHQIPDALKRLHFAPADKYGELAGLLKTQLLVNDIELVRPDGHDPRPLATLQLHQDRLDRRTLSLFPNGQVAEYELIYTVRYAIVLPEQETRQFEFELYRDYQDDPQSALAKSKELKLILKEIRQQAADKIIRQLATLDRR